MPETEAAVAFNVERQTLEDTTDVPDTIAAALQDLQLGIEPLDEATRLVVDEVVRNQVEPAVEQLQERVEAPQAALENTLTPERDASQAVSL